MKTYRKTAHPTHKGGDMWKGINGETAFTLDGHYYLGCGARGGREREIVYWVDDMQQTTGTLSPGAHPGSYNGQDAYNDMLVVGDGTNGNKPQRYASACKYECGIGTSTDGLQRSADNFEGGV